MAEKAKVVTIQGVTYHVLHFITGEKYLKALVVSSFDPYRTETVRLL